MHTVLQAVYGWCQPERLEGMKKQYGMKVRRRSCVGRERPRGLVVRYLT
jgi:hypothetical protein